MRWIVRLVPFLFLAVLPGGCDSGPQDAAIGAARGPERAPGGGVVHLIRITGEGSAVRFEPAELEIEAGDALRIVQTRPIPTAIAVEAEGAGAPAAFVERAGLGRGPLLVDPGDYADLSFEDAPPGAYHYLGLGFEDRGLRGRLRVEGE